MRDDYETESPLPLTPIGVIRSEKRLKFDTRHQATEAPAEHNLLDLHPGLNLDQALKDLDGFSHIWLIWWFHRNRSWRPQVLPPRGPAKRRGLFATRSPHRPNPLGISVVELLKVDGLRLTLGPTDLLDGTPIFDIKPYIAAYDSFPEARRGWLDEADAWEAQPACFELRFSDLSRSQARWLKDQWDIDFTPRLQELLGRDPSPHTTRRIRPRGALQFEIGCGAWRAVFEVQEKVVHVQALEAGYPRKFLFDPKRVGIADRDAQIAFLELWPDQPDRAR